MDQSKLPNTDPTILLLNEIEILLAQTRLMELYLKQAQATAANAAISSERQHQAELDLLRAALAAKEKNLAQLQASIVVPDPRHVKRVEEIEAELIDKQRVIDDRQAELASARSEIATLHDRIRELSAASQRTQAAAAISAAQSEKLQSDLEALGQELEKNRRDFDVHLGSSHELQHNLRAQLQQLHTEVAEKQRSAENVESELTAARSETSALQQRLDELHASRQQVETDGAAKLEQTRARFEAEIAELQTALATHRDERQQNDAAIAAIEGRLGSEIIELRGQLEDKQRQLIGRDNDLRQAQSEIAVLQQQVADREAKCAQAESKYAEFTSLRRAFESEIAELHHQVTLKERELSQRHEAVSAVEIALHGRIQTLQQELDRSRHELLIGQSELNGQRTEIATLNGKIAALESARAEAESAGKRFDDVTRQRVEDELNRLHATLAQKEYALKEQETANRNLQTQLNSEVGQLRQQLAQEESFVQSTQTEIAQLRAETVAQQERIGELEKARQEAVDDWQRAGVIQSELQSRLQAKTDELSSAQASALESRAELETKITELQNELTQQHSVIDSRTTELTELKSQLPQLHAQVGEQESALRQAANRIQEAEQSGAAHQAELARLHDEYQIKFAQLESELTQARAGLDSSDELRAPLEVKINNLQLELAQKQLLADGRSAEIANLKANLQQAMVQIGDLESARRQIAELSQEREQNRTTRERELANLNQQHQIKFQELEDELGQARQSAMEREQQIDEIAERYRQLSADLQARRQHMEAAGAENSTLHDRIRDLEGQRDDQRIQVQGLDRNRIALEAELASLRQEVQQKSWALAQQQASIENLALAHKGQVQKLEARFTDQQSSDGVREAELQNVQTEARSLQHRIEELEAELGQVKLTETSRAEQIRQENFARIEELNALLSQKNSEIEAHSLAQANLEQSLRREVERLLREIDERNGILQNRNDELVRVKADLDATVERLGQLESAARQAETGANGEVESMRTEFQAQLALLQAELSQKEWTLEERQASASSAEQEYRRQIESLRKQISEKESAERQLERDFVIGENQWTEAQPTKSAGSQQSIDSNGGHPQSTSGDSSDRRWHSMFARKRRWKN